MWTFQAYGLPCDREKCAKLVGVKVADDDALKALRSERGARRLRYVSRSRKCGLCPSRSTLLRHKSIYAFWDRLARARCPRPEVPAARWERFTQAGKRLGLWK